MYYFKKINICWTIFKRIQISLEITFKSVEDKINAWWLKYIHYDPRYFLTKKILFSFVHTLQQIENLFDSDLYSSQFQVSITSLCSILPVVLDRLYSKQLKLSTYFISFMTQHLWPSIWKECRFIGCDYFKMFPIVQTYIKIMNAVLWIAERNVHFAYIKQTLKTP